MEFTYTVVVGTILLISLLLLLATTFFLSQGGCSPGTFECTSSNACVPQKAMCNGHVDCPDGEDESVANCRDFHGSVFIFDLMKKANFSWNEEKCEQGGVPRGCFCRNKTWIYCKNLNLTSVPSDIRGNVSRLILANNSISFLKEDGFSEYSLRLLFAMISMLNSLSHITASDKLTLMVVRTHLEGNGIKVLPDTIFCNQTQMQKILLMRNKLTVINDKMFCRLESLSMLFLQNNEINHINIFAFKWLTNLRYLDLSGNKLTLAHGMAEAPNLIELLLDNNLISSLSDATFDLVPKLEYVAIRGNILFHIDVNAFSSLKNLQELDLSHNNLVDLIDGALSSLNNLKKLYLGNNPLTHLSIHIFENLTQLASLDVDNIDFENINEEMFTPMKNLDFIYFKKYYYCTFAPFVPKCAPKSDGISTFENLLGRPFLRISVWIVAISTCIGNGYVFWGRLTTRDDNRSLSWIVRNLAVSDAFMGVYLILIGIKDQEFRGSYHKQSHQWMASWWCCSAGAFAMISSEVSVFTLIFMSIERFLLIAVPFSGHKVLTPRAALRSIAVMWTMGVAIAVCPIVIWRRSTKFYGVNGMCFPLHLDDPYLAGWQYSAFVFLFINLSGVLVLAILYSGMFVSVLRTRHATSLSKGDCEFAIRFFFIVLTNTACWLPIVILKLLALYRIYISADAYAWVTIIVVPVNSAINPLLYTLTTPKYLDTLKSTFQRGRSTILRSKNVLSSLDTSSSNSSNLRKKSGERQCGSFDDTTASIKGLRTHKVGSFDGSEQSMRTTLRGSIDENCRTSSKKSSVVEDLAIIASVSIGSILAKDPIKADIEFNDTSI